MPIRFDREEAINLLRSGVGLREIPKKLGVSRSHFSAHFPASGTLDYYQLKLPRAASHLSLVGVDREKDSKGKVRVYIRGTDSRYEGREFRHPSGGLFSLLKKKPKHVFKFLEQPDEVAPDEVEPDEVAPDEVEPDEVEPDEVEPDEVEPDEVEPELKRALKGNPNHAITREDKVVKYQEELASLGFGDRYKVVGVLGKLNTSYRLRVEDTKRHITFVFGTSDLLDILKKNPDYNFVA